MPAVCYRLGASPVLLHQPTSWPPNATGTAQLCSKLHSAARTSIPSTSARRPCMAPPCRCTAAGCSPSSSPCLQRLLARKEIGRVCMWRSSTSHVKLWPMGKCAHAVGRRIECAHAGGRCISGFHRRQRGFRLPAAEGLPLASGSCPAAAAQCRPQLPALPCQPEGNACPREQSPTREGLSQGHVGFNTRGRGAHVAGGATSKAAKGTHEVH